MILFLLNINCDAWRFSWNNEVTNASKTTKRITAILIYPSKEAIIYRKEKKEKIQNGMEIT